MNDVLAATRHVRSFLELGHHAINHYQQSGGPELCALTGSLTTGGRSFKYNMARYAWTVQRLTGNSQRIFSATMWQPKIELLIEEWKAGQDKGYPVILITDFFGTVFRSGLIRKAFIMPEWQQSVGSSIEVAIYDEVGIEKIDLTPDFFAGMPAFAE